MKIEKAKLTDLKVTAPQAGILLKDLANSLEWSGGSKQLGRPEYHNYHPKSALSLGRGFEKRALTDPKRAFLVFEPVELDQGSPSAGVDIFYLRNKEGLHETTKMDVDVEASYMGFEGSAGYSFETETKFDGSSVNIILRASADYGLSDVSAHGTDLGLG